MKNVNRIRVLIECSDGTRQEVVTGPAESVIVQPEYGAEWERPLGWHGFQLPVNPPIEAINMRVERPQQVPGFEDGALIVVKELDPVSPPGSEVSENAVNSPRPTLCPRCGHGIDETHWLEREGYEDRWSCAALIMGNPDLDCRCDLAPSDIARALLESQSRDNAVNSPRSEDPS